MVWWSTKNSSDSTNYFRQSTTFYNQMKKLTIFLILIHFTHSEDDFKLRENYKEYETFMDKPSDRIRRADEGILSKKIKKNPINPHLNPY